MALGETVGHIDITMAESVPLDTSFLNTYQQHAWRQISWDEGRGTIQGLQPEAYMLKGLREELGEIYGPDKNEPHYDRFNALTLLTDGPRAFEPDSVTPTAVARHLKEFGDSSWYLSNYLKIFVIEFERVIPVGKQAWKADAMSQPRSTYAHHLEIESRLPWISLFSYAGELEVAAEGLLRVVDGRSFKKPRDERILDEQKLFVASGKFVLAMMHVLKARFNTSYADVLEQNRAKLDKRIAENTVFDKSGGDDR